MKPKNILITICLSSLIILFILGVVYFGMVDCHIKKK